MDIYDIIQFAHSRVISGVPDAKKFTNTIQGTISIHMISITQNWKKKTREKAFPPQLKLTLL
jgi:hypothetical protein